MLIAQSEHVLVPGSTFDRLSLAVSRAQPFAWDAWPHNAEQQQTALPIIVLDATTGLRDEDLYNIQLIHFLSLYHPLVLVERMNEIGFEQEQFDLIEEEVRDQLQKANLTPLAVMPAPLSHSAEMKWRLDADRFEETLKGVAEQALFGDPLRIKVEAVTSTNEKWRLDGRLLSGTVCPGDQVLSSPSNQTGTISNVLDNDNDEPNVSENTRQHASGTEPSPISLIFDEPFFADAGEILSHREQAPMITDVFCAQLRWSGGELKPGDLVQCQIHGREFQAALQSIEHALDPREQKTAKTDRLRDGLFAKVTFRLPKLMALDVAVPGRAFRRIGGIVHLASIDGAGQGAGLISMAGYADQRPMLSPKSTNITPVINVVTEEDRRHRNGHDGGVLWFTGLSGSGKSTLAMALEARLFAKGYQVFVLDGDNVRQGLTSNLGFSPGDRAENIRRVGEVAALFRQAGVIVISSFISPYRSDRDRARHAALSAFHEIYIKAHVKTCIARDPKGLYKKALKGDIPEFTGISAPYEEPGNPELVIDTETLSVDACVEQLVNYVDTNFRL